MRCAHAHATRVALIRNEQLVIPKYHAEKAHEVPDEYLADIMPVARKVVNASIAAGLTDNYNILQNNGAIAHQVRRSIAL